MKSTLFSLTILKNFLYSAQVTTLGFLFIVVSIILKSTISSTKNLNTALFGITI